MAGPSISAKAQIGASVARVDGRAKVTGAARYGSDVDVANAAYAYLVTSAVARGRITDTELDEELATLEETRRTAEHKLAALRDHKERIEELERDRDALLEDYVDRTPEALDSLTPKEHHRLYKMLRLSVAIRPDRRAEITGALPESVDTLQNENVLCKT